ncbi:MAG: MBL fold metallo-hydrolase [Patescibacteria group bacterium]
MQILFLGGVDEVTGSCFLIETSRGKLLIDCGMFQGEKEEAKHNFDQFSFDPKSLDAVLVTHAHVDHTGRLPLLVKEGFGGLVYFTPPTKTVAMLILEDAQRVMAENAEKHGDKILYLPEDISRLKTRSRGINYHTEFEPIPGIKAMFHNAGHILGSAYLSLDIPAEEMTSGQATRFIFSGDIGNDAVPILPETEPIDHADYVIVESTYGNREHEPVAVRQEKLQEMISKVIGRGGSLLIPAFSVERTQELLYALDELFDQKKLPKVPIYLDSPLAIHTTEAYRQYKDYLQFDRKILSSPDADFFSFPNLKLTLTQQESKTINNDHRPKIIIAGSGMMTGGRILHHLKRYLNDEKSGLLIIGYQAEGTLGRRIFDGASKVMIYGDEVDVRASVEAIGAFSAHGDRNKLARWLVPKSGEVKKIFLVHGEEVVKVDFKSFLQDKVSSEVIIPKFAENFEF